MYFKSAMSVSDEDLVLLRRKLRVLSYTEAFDNSSGELVLRLTDDLIHATDSYRQLKEVHDARDRELRQYHAKVIVLLRNNARPASLCLSVEPGSRRTIQCYDIDVLNYGPC